MSSSLILEREGPLAWVTLNRPASLNALDRPLVQVLGREIVGLNDDPSVRVVILQGSQNNFCSGVDLKTVTKDQLSHAVAQQRIDEFHRLIHGITESSKPFIASIAGGAVGFGADLALACDLRVFSTEAYLQERFVEIGLMPDGGGTFFLPKLVGLGRAMEFLMLGERIPAHRALELGIANRLAPPDELVAETRALAERIAAKAPLAISAIKRAVRENVSVSLDGALRHEKRAQANLLQTDDFKEGVLAWGERRQARFKGQ